MADLNNVIIQGRFTHDPELKQTSNGTITCSFTIACNRRKNSNGEEKADFISVTAYNRTAEIVGRYFCKGKPIIIRGKLKTRKYADSKYKEIMHHITEVEADEIFFAGKTKAEESMTPGIHFDVPDMPDKLDDFEEIITGDDEVPF